MRVAEKHAYRLNSRTFLSGRTSACEPDARSQGTCPRGRQGSGNELKVILRSARKTYSYRWEGEAKKEKERERWEVSVGFTKACLLGTWSGQDRLPRVSARTPCHGLGLKMLTDVDLKAWMPMTMRCISDFGRYRRNNQCFPTPWVVYQIANLKPKTQVPLAGPDRSLSWWVID